MTDKSGPFVYLRGGRLDGKIWNLATVPDGYLPQEIWPAVWVDVGIQATDGPGPYARDYEPLMLHYRRDPMAVHYDEGEFLPVYQHCEEHKMQESQGPTAAADAISMCAECCGLLDDGYDQARHQGRVIDRCRECSSHSLCPLNPRGPHERIIWPEDSDFDPEEAMRAPGPVPDGCCIGYCQACLQPFLYQRASHPRFVDLTWEHVGYLWAVESGSSDEGVG